MRLHSRTLPTQKAHNELERAFLDWLAKHPLLTFVEMAMGVTRLLDIVHRYALRAERHPDDPNKKGDEE